MFFKLVAFGLAAFAGSCLWSGGDGNGYVMAMLPAIAATAIYVLGVVD